MATRKYASLGIRRDKNLSDVENPVEALDNILNDLSGEGTFESKDLDAIKNLQFEKVNSAQLSDLAGITITVTNPNDLEGPPITAEPLITLKDRVERAKITTGPVAVFRGGLGLDARFIRSDEINPSNSDSNGTNLFLLNANQPIEKNYWEYGFFEHDTLLDKTFDDQYGGIQWNGYFTPELYDPNPTINFQTMGLLIVEYDPLDNNNWVKLVNLYAQTRSVSVTSTTTGNTVQISANDVMRISINDKLTTNNQISITSVGPFSISLSANLSVNAATTISFTKNLGTDMSYGGFSLPAVEPGNQIKIRISYWYPNNGQTIENKWLYLSYPYSFFDNDYLPFVYLSPDKANTPGPDEIRTFLKDALSPYNNNFGKPGTSGNDYKNLYVSKTYINDYFPKNSLSQIRSVGTISINYNANSNIITSGSSLANANIGDYIIPISPTGNQLPKTLQVKNKLGTNSLIVSDKPSVSGSQQVDIIDHKGLIDWYFANSTGANVTVTTNTSNIQTNNVIITDSTASYVRITSIINSTSFSTSTNLNLTGTEPIYVYSEKGLTDKSKLVFCGGVFGVTLAANAAPGNTMVMTSNSGIVIGQVVQYNGYINESPATTVTAVAGNTVSLSGTSPITNLILKDSTITFAPSGTTVNKEICVIPLNNAPPFVGISDGLSTVNRGIKSANTLLEDFVVETSNLTINTVSTNITSVSGTQQYDRKIKINNNQYFILGKLV